METRTILDFFENNNCKLDMFERNCGDWTFSIYSNDQLNWILTDANEFMLKEFYLKCITPKN